MTQRGNRPRAALYHRSSVTEPEVPWRKLRAAATARGYDVAAEIEEATAAAEAPALERLVATVPKRRIDAVLLWSLGALGDSLGEILGNVRKLIDAGFRTEIVAPGLIIDPRDQASKSAMLSLISALADMPHSIRSEATRAGLQRARSKGRRLGRPPRSAPSHS